MPSGTADGVILGKQNGGFVGGCWRLFEGGFWEWFIMTHWVWFLVTYWDGSY